MPCVYEKIGGAGNKFTLLIDNLTDTYYYPVPGLSSWDVCAAEALLSAMGGKTTDLNKVPIHYTESL